MARPRFQRLPADRQDTIMDAALREFAAHGFGGASLNRIIAAAELSKGSLYYYFDGKEDLYADVIRRQVERLVHDGGPAPTFAGADADAFWGRLEEYYLRLMRLLEEVPATGALLRDWLTGPAPSMRAAEEEAEQATLPWLMEAVAAGQRIGAVRADLPDELLIALALGMGQAMDTWLITRRSGERDLADAVHALIDMMRRAFQP
nr:TetR/AcrR family transcriptional regulator [Microbacterium bovistercoris]